MAGFKRTHLFILFFALALAGVSACVHGPVPASVPPAGIAAENVAENLQNTRDVAATTKYTLPQILAKARAVMVPQAGTRASTRLAESELVGLLQSRPSLMRAGEPRLLEELETAARTRDAGGHVRLIPPAGQPGYSDLKAFVNHSYYKNGRLQPPANILNVWREFIQKTEKSLVLNVYDFDLEEVARDLIALKRRGLKVRVGLDKNVILERPEVAAIAELLDRNGVTLVRVDPVSLNHQKMAARDWEDPAKAAVLFSSGNLTQSCLGPEGDLKELSPRPRESIPNANHVLTMKSYVLANLVAHELAKTLGPELFLRGAQYPLSGAYQVTGPGVDPQTLEAYPEKSVIITFTPGGGYRAANQNLLAQLIETVPGPIRLVQFAYSSQPVADAIFHRAQKSFQQTGDFDFLAIGDTPFAMQKWSQFLKMSGLKREKTAEGKAHFSEDRDSQWEKSLRQRDITKLRGKIRVAPAIYGNKVVKVGGVSYDVTSKVHHKLMSVGDFAVVGTSFNFSEAAESNNEQLLIFRDPALADMVQGIARALTQERERTVYDEAERRNSGRSLDEGDMDMLEEQRLRELGNR